MEKRGYVFNGVIFLVFVPVLVLAIYYSSNVSDIAGSDYQEIRAMKVYYISANVYEIMNQSKLDLLDNNPGKNICANLVPILQKYIGDTNDPTSGPPVKLHNPIPSKKLACTGAPPRKIEYLNVTTREDNPTVWICRGCS